MMRADAQQRSTDGEARERAGEGDEGFVARAGRLGLDGGGPTKDEERDAADLQPEPAGDDGVRQLVRKDRREEEDGRPRSQQPVLARRPARDDAREERVGKRERQQEGDHQPTGVNREIDAGHPAEPPS